MAYPTRILPPDPRPPPPRCRVSQGGSQGARLTHSHERQFNYVLQSLTLWREISHEARAAVGSQLFF